MRHSYSIFACLAAYARRTWSRWCGGSLQRKTVTDVGLSVPATPYSNESKVVRYEELTDLKEFTEPDHVMMIRHQGGTERIDMLSDERAYGEIVSAHTTIELSRLGLSARA